ncbi:MAG: hypothetical protein GY823_01705 [Flavobacteriaceae bacterium]|nr:hypothetical protein [Flavobacteriaceae bacterium]
MFFLFFSISSKIDYSIFPKFSSFAILFIKIFLAIRSESGRTDLAKVWKKAPKDLSELYASEDIPFGDSLILPSFDIM